MYVCTAYQLCLVNQSHGPARKPKSLEMRKYDRDIYVYAVLSSSVMVITTSVIFALGFSSLARWMASIIA